MVAEKVPKLFNMPNWVWLIVIVAAVAVLVVYAPSTPPAGDAGTDNPLTSADNGDVLTHDVSLPGTVVEISVSPAQPVAGDNISFTAKVSDPYVSTWQDNFSYELWVRQFGNWQKTSCYSSTCEYALADASQGTVEYKIVRTAKDGSVTEEGSYYLEVSSTVQTGDTLGPKVTVYHTPENPKAGQTVSIVALVNDISSLERVDIFHNGEIIKTCPQKVKISQCQVSVPSLSVGTYTYYAYSIDSFGNETTSSELSYSVSAT